MHRRTVGIVLAAAAIGLLFAAVATSGGVGLWIEPQWDPAPGDIEPIEFDAGENAVDQFDADDRSDASRIEIPSWLAAILNAVGATIAIIAVIALLRAGWKRRPRLRWGRRAIGSQDFDVLPDVADAIVDDAAEQRAALLTGEPRNAIVECWLRLEHDVAAAGLPRPPADTSAEFTERVLGNYSVDSGAIGELAALYREARFSDHRLDETARSAALDALDRLHRALVDERDGAPSRRAAR